MAEALSDVAALGQARSLKDLAAARIRAARTHPALACAI
tara:strand:- start:346 stop:462 length:117 start_codon:yes stop_codon:yes gene_type:complete